jgi:AcrR family transcriptional regulator
MGSTESTRERILNAAETLLRRHGLAKTTVVDVARTLGMSHANVYRHFASKAELQDALVERWLQMMSTPLAEIAERAGPASERLEEWALAFIAAKRRKVLNDPELFAAYHTAAEAARAVVDAHRAATRAQLTRIISDGAASGEFVVHDVDAAVAAVFDGMLRFFHPHLILEAASNSNGGHLEDDARRMLRLLIAGLKAGAI